VKESGRGGWRGGEVVGLWRKGRMVEEVLSESWGGKDREGGGRRRPYMFQLKVKTLRQI